MNIKFFSLSKRAPFSAAKVGFLTLMLGLGISAPGEAATIRATTSGLDSGFNRISEHLDIPLFSLLFGSNDFFTVGFEGDPSEGKYVEWLSYELNFNGQAPDAYFDPIELGFDSSPKVGRTQGIDASQISFSPVDRLSEGPPFGPSNLKISFAANSFGIGDFFTFGVDTNGLGDSIPALAVFNPFFMDDVTLFNDGGGEFGLDSVLFQVKLQGRDNISQTNFRQTGLFSSEATVTVPTPALLPGLIGMGVAALRKRKSEDEESTAA